jgi:hypothetical protein
MIFKQHDKREVIASKVNGFARGCATPVGTSWPMTATTPGLSSLPRALQHSEHHETGVAGIKKRRGLWCKQHKPNVEMMTEHDFA